MGANSSHRLCRDIESVPFEGLEEQGGLASTTDAGALSAVPKERSISQIGGAKAHFFNPRRGINFQGFQLG